MPKNKKISIIMGIYNCAKTLSKAIDSVIGQTYTDWELIMCDDCSSDNTYQVAQGYVNRFPDKMTLLHNEKNCKLAYSLNRCLECATGGYIARMDGDDISAPTRLEREMEYLAAHSEFDLVGCAMRRFDENGLADVVYAVDEPNYYTLRKRVPYHHATILARREVYDTLNGYTVSDRTMRGQDYDLWFRFYHAGFRGNNLREPLYLVREDSDAIRRRTFQTRWNAYKTTRYGFKLLNYPKWWLIRPTIETLTKSATPYFVVELYRKLQKKKG